MALMSDNDECHSRDFCDNSQLTNYNIYDTTGLGLYSGIIRRHI